VIGVLVIGLAAFAGEVRTRLLVEPAEVELGRPFELVLEVRHPVSVEVALGGGEDVEEYLDGSWVLFGSRREPSRIDPDDPGSRVTRRVWELASLEPGARTLPGAFVAAIVPAATEVLETATASVTVVSLLGEEEDGPRPLAGFAEDFGRSSTADERRGWLPWVLVLAGLVVIGALAWALQRARSRPPAVAPPAHPLDRLAAIAADLKAGEADVADLHFALSSLLREATDGLLGRTSEGMSDDEWLLALAGEPRVGAEARERLAEALERCSEVKYAGQRPTGWALEETLERARRALEAVGAGREDAA